MKYFKNTSWLFGEKILRMTVGLFVGVWVARYLGPEQFGLFRMHKVLLDCLRLLQHLGSIVLLYENLSKMQVKEMSL